MCKACLDYASGSNIIFFKPFAMRNFRNRKQGANLGNNVQNPNYIWPLLMKMTKFAPLNKLINYVTDSDNEL